MRKPAAKKFKPIRRVRSMGNSYKWYILDGFSHAVLAQGQKKFRRHAEIEMSQVFDTQFK